MNLEDLYRLLRSSHAQAQGIVDTIDEPLVVLDDRGCVLEANRAFFGTFLVERDDTIGVPLRNLGNGQWDVPALTKLMAEVIPKATAVIDYEITHDFPHIGRRTFLLTARQLWKPDNNSTTTLLVFRDVTDSRDKEREASLLFSELRHRMTNLLGIVRAIANQTETEGKSAAEYKTAFLGRFEALVQAQSLLSGVASAIDLDDLVSSIVGGLGGNRLHVSGGQPVRIAEKQIVPMTMILHELGTNALKYGAFSDEKGTVDISWTVETAVDPRWLRFVWAENCASPVAAPAKKAGMGTGIVQNSAKLGLHGSAELTFGANGLIATLVVPLIEDNEREQPGPSGTAGDRSHPGG